MKRIFSIMAALALVCALTSSAIAEQFDQALGADKLSLAPVNLTLAVDEKVLNEAVERYEAQISLLGVEKDLFPDARSDSVCLLNELSGDELYENIRIISVSPDGNKYLIAMGDAANIGKISASLDGLKFFAAMGDATGIGGTLAVWDETDGSIRFLAPKAGLTAEDVYLLLSYQLQRIEEPGIIWSPDGGYITFSYINWAFKNVRFESGTLLIDTEKGEIKPLVELSNRISLTDFDEKYPGVPIRCAFDPSGKFLYYEVYNPLAGNAINRYDLETGETKKMIETGSWLTSLDPKLWWTEDGLMTMFTNVEMEEGFGISFRPLGGETALIHGDVNAILGIMMYSSNLISVAGRSGILYSTRAIDLGSQMPLLRSMVLYSLDSLTGDVFQKTLFIRPDAPPDQRLEIVAIPPDAAPGDMRPLIDDLDEERLVQPVSGTLSPDGQYAFFATQNKNLGAALYVYDIERNVCGRVNLNALDMDSKAFMLYSFLKRHQTQSFLWLGNNRVLLSIGGVSRLYEFQF